MEHRASLIPYRAREPQAASWCMVFSSVTFACSFSSLPSCSGSSLVHISAWRTWLLPFSPLAWSYLSIVKFRCLCTSLRPTDHTASLSSFRCKKDCAINSPYVPKKGNISCQMKLRCQLLKFNCYPMPKLLLMRRCVKHLRCRNYPMVEVFLLSHFSVDEPKAPRNKLIF